MQDNIVDTFWYDGPMAARFVREGSITAARYLDRGPMTAFFPGGLAPLHAVGMLMFGNDVARPVLNLVFAVLALVAGWSIGSRWGLGPRTMLAVVVVLGTSMLTETQSAGMYNDMVGLALVLASVALLVAIVAIAQVDTDRVWLAPTRDVALARRAGGRRRARLYDGDASRVGLSWGRR